MRRRGSSAALWLPLLAFAPGRTEVAPMTRERIQEVEQAVADASGVWRFFFVTVCTTSAASGAHDFDVRITTPFGVMASSALLAKEAGTRLDLAELPLEPPDEQRVIVTADPAVWSSSAPASVARVFLRRGDRIIEHVRADGHDVLFPQSKAPITRRGGAYYFPLEPFASSLGDLEILVVAEGGRIEDAAVVRINSKQLAALR